MHNKLAKVIKRMKAGMGGMSNNCISFYITLIFLNHEMYYLLKKLNYMLKYVKQALICHFILFKIRVQQL